MRRLRLVNFVHQLRYAGPINRVAIALSRAFELLRYRYENAAPPDFQYYLDDLPHMLGHLILGMKPEWEQSAATISVVPPSFSEDWEAAPK